MYDNKGEHEPTDRRTEKVIPDGAPADGIPHLAKSRSDAYHTDYRRAGIRYDRLPREKHHRSRCHAAARSQCQTDGDNPPEDGETLKGHTLGNLPGGGRKGTDGTGQSRMRFRGIFTDQPDSRRAAGREIGQDITEVELKALWDAGIDGVLVEADAAQGGDLTKLHETAGKLPPRSARKRGKMDVLLPRMAGETGAAAPPAEEE